MFEGAKERLRKAGWWGVLIVNILSISWSTAVAALISLLLVVWGTTYAIIQTPAVQAWALVFLFLLWTYIGLTVLWDRKTPKLIAHAQDYSYGLTFVGLHPMINVATEDDQDMIRFAVSLTNFAPSPI